MDKHVNINKNKIFYKTRGYNFEVWGLPYNISDIFNKSHASIHSCDFEDTYKYNKNIA